jgi:hypothetical protein
MFGGWWDYSGWEVGLADTWEWDGSAWTVQWGDGPGARFGQRMVYDEARGRFVMFGGSEPYVDDLDETWEWDSNVGWTQCFPSTRPRARYFHAMAYDRNTGQVMLFGGEGSVEYRWWQHNDLWVWDGTNWTQITSPGPVPCVRSYHAMAYDPLRHRLVMFGGVNSHEYPDTVLGDTWEWDGASWHLVVPAGSFPAARWGHTMTFDEQSGRVVLFGGKDANNGLCGDVWEWDGTDWLDLTPVRAAPLPRIGAAMAFDGQRGQVVLFGGNRFLGQQFQVFGDTWVYDGSRWRWPVLAGPSPDPRYYAAMAYDCHNRRVLLFGGQLGDPYSFSDSDQTWSWDGQDWELLLPPTSPPPRDSFAMAYDSGRERLVLFGGDGGRIVYSDTWEWDGTTWTQVEPAANHPSERFGPAMAYDEHRGRTVLFGGASPELVVLPDTWEWDGTDWTLANAGTMHLWPRVGHVLVYDSARERVVLFGGSNYPGPQLNDTWEWDGSLWRRLTTGGSYPAAQPAPRADHAMAYDARRNCIVMFGGANFPMVTDQTWECYVTPVPAAVTASPTATATATWRPPTATPTPSLRTPTATPPLPTATQTPSPAQSATPTPEPSPATGVEFYMPGTLFHEGDVCYLNADIFNGSPQALTGYPFFVVLELSGEYWFGPSWVTLSQGIDYYEETFATGVTRLEIVPEFHWPSGVIPMTGATFWGALTDPGMSRTVGTVGTWEFGWR